VFTEAASGDRMLTMDGNQAAYIEGARWVAPAQGLFEEAVFRAFARNATVARLVERRQSASANYVLNLDVETFEARYVAGPKAAPTVVVALRAQLIHFPERAVIAEKTFHAEQAASDNRVSAIVPAYDAAVTSVLKDLTAWADASASAG
jgi:cholesterol transport system auxiliary component